MPWNETDAMDQRSQFVMAYSSGRFEMTELCRLYGVSRPTGYKWVERHRAEGVSGLKERSRAPRHCPHRMSAQVERWLLGERRAHPQWGPRKLLRRYRNAHLQRGPSRSAVADLLRRQGLSQPRRRRRVCGQGGGRVGVVTGANEVWTIDFKGQFRMGDGRWCYPLTVMDSASRYLLGCHGEPRILGSQVKQRMRGLFEHYGLPCAIHSDNGVPFASSTGLTGLSRLSVSWLKLGIELRRSRPGCPQDNGAHERMHRTLKAETARPPAATLRAQQCRFHRFRQEYNEERPHQALQDRTPSQLYACSPRSYPARLLAPEYPAHFEVRRVRTDGTIKWQGGLLFVTKSLCSELVALEEVDDGLWSVWFMAHLLGRIDLHTKKITYVPV